MNALAWMKSTGVAVDLTSEGGLELDGLESLDDGIYARVLDVARAHKAEIVAELKNVNMTGLDIPARGEAAPAPPDASPLDALARFERDPRGVVAWLAQQKQGQPPHLVERWAATIRAEARLRIAEAEGVADHGRA
ncbi:hypothetical protein [Fundidesulfovibrio putealis]|uniref:hypothetical protein n=1 Tax=Fundidesulfovibrio putealis TaxID=270496 RepID=UPI0003F52BA4|nr:hypothetical protein [Fundidesulfovibrio putealis]